MKASWAMLIGFVMIVGICLIGVGYTAADIIIKHTEEGEHWFETVDRSSDVKVIRHRETGVCYITTGYDTEPLLRSDGSLYILGE